MKKFLSLAMALAMVLSLFTMSTMANAADFTDDDSINYVEAVDVISAIKVIDGYTDGSFKPTEALTRGAAAKIITNMILGPSTASTLIATAAPFPDVPANHTFAPYIAYCAQNGIINGYADGTFAPSGRLTGFAFLKMLLGALGYDGAIEGFTGANWSIQVAKIADGIGLTENLMEGFSGTDSVDRQTACLFAFNTLKADLVEYNNRITANVGGVDVAIGGNNIAHSKTAQTQASQANASNIVNEWDEDDNSYRIVQFAEEYFPRLIRNNKKFKYNAEYGDLSTGDGGLDAMGRPATTWVYQGEKIGTYAEEADATYNGSKKLNEIYSDLGMSNSTENVFIYVNGILWAEKGATYKTTRLNLSRGNDSKLSDWTRPADFTNGARYDNLDAKIGDGSIVEVYRNDKTNEVIISCQQLYGGKIASVHGANDKKDDFVRIEWGEVEDHYPDTIENDGMNEFETTVFAEDDVVAYTYSDQAGEGIQSMYKMESVTGALSEFTAGKSLKLGDTVYKYAKDINFSGGLKKEDDMTNRSSYVVYLDSNGYALWVEEDEFSADAYAVILRMTSENSDGDIILADADNVDGAKTTDRTGAWDGNRVRLLFSDGTTRTVDLDKSYVTGSAAKFDAGYGFGKIIRWRVTDKGAYKLSTTSTTAPTDAFEITGHNVKGFANSKIVADSKTLFVINDHGDYVTYIGVRNVPEVTGVANASKNVYAYVKDNVIKVLFINDPSAKVLGSGKAVTFLAGQSASKPIKQGDNDTYYTYNAVVRGEITTVKVRGVQDDVSYDYPSAVNPGKKNNVMMNQTSFDGDDLLRWGYYDDMGGDYPNGSGEGIRKLGGFEVRVDTKGDDYLYSVASNADIFYIDDGGDIEKIEYSGISTSTKVDVYWVLYDGEIVSLFICEQ